MLDIYVPATGAYIAYVARKGATVYDLLQLSLPQETVYLSEAPFDRYEPRITKGGISEVQRSVSISSTGLATSSVDVTVANPHDDPRMELLLEGSYDCRRAPAVILRGAPPELLGLSDWRTRFTGILDSWDYNVAEPDTVTLHLKVDDLTLRNSWLPNVQLLKSEWGEGSYVMPDGVSGTYAPLLYGTHNSSGVTGRGFVPLICVGQTGATGRYAVSLGRVKAKIGTWKATDGSVIPGTMEYVVRGGKVFTTVNFTSGITAGLGIWGDFDGYEAVGDGSGVAITNPARQLWHLLSLVYTDWKSGTYWPGLEAAPIDQTSFAAAIGWFDRYKIEGSARIGGSQERISAASVVDRWTKSFPLMKLYWNEYGQIAIFNLAAMTEWPGYMTSSSRRCVADSLESGRRTRVIQDAGDLARQISATHLFSAANSQSYGSIDVQNLGVIEKVTESIQADWSLARAV